VEYGHKVWLNEVDGRIVSHYRVLDCNPSYELQWEPSLQVHQKTFNSPPQQASADRGVSPGPNEQTTKDLGV
jgi:IS5 family transposase